MVAVQEGRRCVIEPPSAGPHRIVLVDEVHGPRRIELYVDGCEVTRVFGRDGERHSTRRYDDLDTTVREVAAAIARLRRRGYVIGQRNAALEAAIAAAPDEPSNYQVYADYLTSRGDVRGELIAIATALDEQPDHAELAAREQALLAGHPYWLSDPRWRALPLTWRFGYVEGLYTSIELERWFAVGAVGTLPHEQGERRVAFYASWLAEQLAGVRHHPSGAFVRRVYTSVGVYAVRYVKLEQPRVWSGHRFAWEIRRLR